MTDRVRWGAVLCAALVIVGAVGGVPVATASAETGVESDDDANEAPLADAGLDQSVSVNATVHLDASGSRDPDGSIASYEWSIERPDGTPTSPRCDTCAQSEFQVGMAGRYVVTVTVTDDDGATSTDTLYVDVADVEGPSVEIAGPTTVTAGTNVTFEASARAGDEPLLRIDWALNGGEIADESVRGESATDQIERSFEPGTYELTAEILSEVGRTDTARLVVEVVANASGRDDQSCPEATWNGTLGRFEENECDDASGLSSASGLDDGDNETACARYDREDEFYCNNDRLLYGNEDKIIIHDADNDGEVTVMGETLDAENSSSGMGRSYTLTRAEYKERFDTDVVQPLDVQDNSSRGEEESSTTEVVQGSENSESSSNSHDKSRNSDCEHVPQRYQTNC